LSKWVTWPNPARPSRVDDLVSQPNPAHFLASQKNLNWPGPPRVGGLNGLTHGFT